MTTNTSTDRKWPTRNGHWGVRQIHKGEPTGGGTVGLGWDTREDAETANPPHGEHKFVAFDRWPDCEAQ